MTFGWQGFSLEHPEDWAPVTLSGTRSEGYARIASPNRLSLQVRWKAAGSGVDLNGVLSTYLDRLKHDAKRAKKSFDSHVEQDSETLLYRYTSTDFGRGAILYSEPSGRVFFLEAISSKNDSLLPVFRKVLASFSTLTDSERWALFGLDLKLPVGLEVEKKTLQAGRTQLSLVSKKARIEAERWGFAEQLVEKHGLLSWAQSVLAMPKAKVEETSDGVQLSNPPAPLRKSVIGMARLQPERNQISTVKVTTNDDKWRPTWDWFA